MTINNRFEWIIKILFHGNKSAFAKSVGISPTVVENVVGTRKGKPSYDVLYKVCANANISAEWLFFGEESDPVMEMFNIRKELEITAPYTDENGDEKELKTTFGIGPKKIEEHSIKTATTDLTHHLKDQLREKEIEIGALHEDIGMLKERIRQLEQRLGKDAASVSTAITANVG